MRVHGVIEYRGGYRRISEMRVHAVLKYRIRIRSEDTEGRRERKM